MSDDSKVRAAVQAVLTAAQVELPMLSPYTGRQLITELIEAVRSETLELHAHVATAAREVADDFGLVGTDAADAFCRAFEKFADKLEGR